MNNKFQKSTGKHWVTVVYEIKSLEPEATTRQSSEVAVDAADRESPLIPLGPFAEIRGGSSAMQAFAGVKSLEPEATTRQSSEVVVDAADRESPQIPLAPSQRSAVGAPRCNPLRAYVLLWWHQHCSNTVLCVVLSRAKDWIVWIAFGTRTGTS